MVEVLWDCIFHLIVMYTLLFAIVLSCLVLLIGNYYLSAELTVTTSHFLRPGKVTEGDLCCAQYAEDHRWYRGRITGLLEGNKVTRGVAS